MPVVSLVDFNNDCVSTSLAVARALGSRLGGVRLDTSESLVDRSVVPQMGGFDPRGVNPQLVRNVRNALDAEGFSEVRIVVSGGSVQRRFADSSRACPRGSYGGVGLFRGSRFHGDVVSVDGGRCPKPTHPPPNARLGG